MQQLCLVMGRIDSSPHVTCSMQARNTSVKEVLDAAGD